MSRDQKIEREIAKVVHGDGNESTPLFAPPKKSVGYPDVPMKRERCIYKKGRHRCTFAAVDQGLCNTHLYTVEGVVPPELKGTLPEPSASKKSGHHATKKSPAQLQREIDEVLAGKGGATSGLTPAQRAYVSLFEQDVRKHPEAYKAMVRADPAAYAQQVIGDLDDEDVRQFTRDLRAEMKMVARSQR